MKCINEDIGYVVRHEVWHEVGWEFRNEVWGEFCAKFWGEVTESKDAINEEVKDEVYR